MIGENECESPIKMGLGMKSENWLDEIHSMRPMGEETGKNGNRKKRWGNMWFFMNMRRNVEELILMLTSIYKVDSYCI